MFSQIFYLLRSRDDGRYLAAQVPTGPASDGGSAARYVLMFQEQADALSYLNAHAPDMASHFSVESVTGSQLKPLLQRWEFSGMGLVHDPLIPRVEFLSI